MRSMRATVERARRESEAPKAPSPASITPTTIRNRASPARSVAAAATPQATNPRPPPKNANWLRRPLRAASADTGARHS